MMQYVWPFAIGCLASVILTAGVRFISRFVSLASRRSEIKKSGMRLGGLAIGLAFFIAVFFAPNLVIDKRLLIMLLGGFLILILGFWDDIRERSWLVQLTGQLLIATLIFWGGIRINYVGQPFSGEIIYWSTGGALWLSFLVGTLWILAITNAINWLDGVDGVAGGVAFITSLAIFFLSLKPEVNQPPMAILALALGGAILGFLFFNFPPAKVFAGTSGAFFLGFMLSVMAIFAGTKIATTLIILLIPVFDFIRVIGLRLYKKQKPYLPDNLHFHHLLQKAGWSDKRIALSIYGVTILLSLTALLTRPLGKILAVAISLVIAGLATLMWKKVSNGKIWLGVIFLALLFAGLVVNIFFIFHPYRTLLEIKGEKFEVSVPTTPKKWQQGLSGRKAMSDHEGMLFIFPQPGFYYFWMKDMNFDLDIIYLLDNRIVFIAPQISHEDGMKSRVVSPMPANQVLEVMSGTAQKLFLQVGDSITIY